MIPLVLVAPASTGLILLGGTAGARPLAPADDRLLLSIEHRAAPSRSGVPLALRATDGAVALQLVDATAAPRDPPPAPASPVARLEEVLADSDRPLSLTELRQACRMRTASLCQALATLTAQGRVHKSAAGYALATVSRDPFPAAPLQAAGNGSG